MIEATDLIRGCDTVMAAVESAATLLDVDLPLRRIVNVGGAVYDCPQVVVSAMSSDTGVVTPEGGAMSMVGPCDVTWNVTYEISITIKANERNTGPRGQIAPTSEMIRSDTESISAMYAVLINAVESLAADPVGLGRVTASFSFGQPEGGFISVVANVNANLWVPAAT